MADRREEILNSELGLLSYRPKFSDSLKNCIKGAMDVYMKECCLEYIEFAMKKTTGHSIDKDGNLEFKYGDLWISKEELFENFL